MHTWSFVAFIKLSPTTSNVCVHREAKIVRLESVGGTGVRFRESNKVKCTPVQDINVASILYCAWKIGIKYVEDAVSLVDEILETPFQSLREV